MKIVIALTCLLIGNFLVNSLMSGTATTTRYWDCSGGACGCGWGSSAAPDFCHANAMFRAPGGNPYNAKFYGTAAISNVLGGGNWLAPGCGKCWKVSAQGSTIVLKGTNYCPPANPSCNNQPHFDIAAPGFDYPGASISNTCTKVEPNIQALHPPQVCAYWSSGSCNCDALQDHTLVEGCKNFLTLQWNNPNVYYEELSECPNELKTTPPCWKDNGNKWPSTCPARCSVPSMLQFLQ